MIRRLFLAIQLFLTILSYGQQSDYTICDCCSYSMFQYKNDYNTVFSPEIIKANGIKELTIYTTSKQSSSTKDSVFNLVDKEYREMIFRFNSNGYVQEQIIFNRRGQYHSLYEFTRDNNNKVLTKTFHYLNESGNKVDDFLPDKWIYLYSDGQLVKVKKLGEKFTEQPDTKSDYNLYNYDNNGRIVSETRQLYYDWTEPTYYQTLTKYNDTVFSSTATTRDKKKLFSVVKSKFTSDYKLLNEKFYDGRNNKLLEEKIFAYNTGGQLIKFQVKSSGMGTECPDGGNFIDSINYNSYKLIGSMNHKYKNTICQLRFDYK